MVTYQVVPERSTVWIEASSSVHPIHGEATGLQGELDLTWRGDQLDPGAPVDMRVRLPVDLLHSGNAVYDAALRRVVDVNRYPLITGRATEVAPIDAGRYRVTGEVMFHGVARTVAGEVTISGDPVTELVIEGERDFDVTEFGIRPPRILMLRVYPDVRVRVRAVARPETIGV